MTNNENNNLLAILARNNTNRNRQKPPTNTREQNIQKISQSQVELNRVKEALRNFATTSNNNSQFNVTRSQVVKYHKLARDQLLRNNRDILTEMLNLETTTHTLTLKDIKLSDNFFNAIYVPPPPGVAATGTAIRNAIVAAAGAGAGAPTAFTPNVKLPDGWKKYYKLSKLVSTIRGTAKFPWQGPGGSVPAGSAALQQALQSLQGYHNTIFGALTNDQFSVKLSQENGESLIVIRYKANPYHIDWTYTPSDTLNYALTFLRKLPGDFVKFSLDHISNLNSSNNNHKISASIVPMFTKNQSTQLVRTAMEQAGFPSRFWQMNQLKQKAQNNRVNNFSGNFLNTKKSRIESFLGKVDDLFTLISNGQQAHLTPTEIRKIIDSFAINPHMYTLEAQDQAIKQITKPLQRANNNRQILLANPNYNNNDKRILSFPTGASLIGVVELLVGVEIDDYTYGSVGIRDIKNRDSGTTINSNINVAAPSIIETQPQFKNYVKNETFVPTAAAQGNLHKAVTCIAHFCIWFGTAPAAPGGTGAFTNLRKWYEYYKKKPNATVWPRQILQYKQFTRNKIKYLISVLPGHFKLIPLLKEYCEANKSDGAYIWFLSLDILRN